MSFLSRHFQNPLILAFLLAIIVIAVGVIAGSKLRNELNRSYALERNWKNLGIKKGGLVSFIPIVLAVFAFISAICAAAGPLSQTLVPRDKATVVLALDISRSMDAKDVSPSRFEAAKSSIKRFLTVLPDSVNVGLVTFDAAAAGVVNPTTNRSIITRALDGLQLGDGTATGAAINEARKMIKEYNKQIHANNDNKFAQVIMLSDGKQTSPTANIESEGGAILAARAAQGDGIIINTIAFGTPNASITLDGETIQVPVDVRTMKIIATLAGGKTAHATTGAQLNEVYKSLGTELGYEQRKNPNPRPWEWATLGLLLAATLSSIVINRDI